MTQNATQRPALPPYSFYMVRHGESEANVRRVAAGGGLDSPLTENGIQQAKLLASVIHHLPIKPSRVYHSPQVRAKNTAGYINQSLQLEMVELHDLREHMFGDWENVVWETIRPLADQGASPPNGESYEEFAARVSNIIHQIFETPHDAPPMLVAHGGLFRSIGRLYKAPMEHVSNCCLYHFTPAPENGDFPWSVISYTPCTVSNTLKQEKLF
jgi:broad specificity phosphatase PhoE